MSGLRPLVRARWLIVLVCLLALGALPGARSARNALAAGAVTGVVFQDFNGNGARDTAATIANSGAGTVGVAVDRGVAGVTVTAYDANGAPSGNDTTNANGAYTLTLTGTGPYRIEFTNLPAGFQPSAFGPDSGTTVQFVPDGNSANVDLGIGVPGEYCQNNPDLATSCYYYGDPVAGQWANELQLLSFPYAAGAATATANTTPPYGQPATHALALPASQVGVTWGLAYQRSTKRLFAAAHMKKHSGFGPGGPGAIYTIDTTNSTVLNTFAVPGATTNAHDPADYNADNGNAAWDAVGKTALGGVALSDDETRLYVMNLESRTLYALDATTPNLGVAASLAVPTAGVPTPGGSAATCAPGDVRPFALSFYRGQLYAGMVCSAESTQSAADLFAYVYKVDPATLAFDAAPAFQFALAYPRGLANTLSPTSFAEWRPWSPTFQNLVPYDAVTPRLVYPQPWLTDISFDDGNLVLGLRDRLGDQAGNMAHDDPANPTLLYYGTSAGDILRACGDPASGWTLESNASCGGVTTAGADSGQGPPVGPPAGTTGYGEYYYGDRFATLHDETTIGGTVHVPGFPDVAVTGMDPIPFVDAPANTTYYDGGVRWLSNATGNHVKAYRIFDGNRGDGKTFGKVSGLGDLVALCDAAPIEIGNRVWRDSNANGVQDPGEPAIAGATVRLYDGASALIATSVTDADGTYYFSGGPGADTASAKYGLAALGPNKSYSVRLDNPADYGAGGPLAGLALTTANADTSPNGDSRDSDATLAGGFPRIDLTTGAAGHNDHTYDVGFVAAATTKLSLGNLVWYDTNDNGAVDQGEPGVPGVVVRLYADSNGDGGFDPGDAQVGGDQVTDASGAYLFANLTPGDYFVLIPQLNFAGTGKLAGYTNSTGASPGDANNDKDHGIGSPSDGTLSEKVTLTSGGEPTDDGDADPNTNLTIDFGFYRLSVGNQLWRDDDNDGQRDAGEPGVAGARVELYDAANKLVAATTTGADGGYRFDGLATGGYYVKVPPSQFAPGAPLAGFHSSSGNGEPPPSPNDNLDDRDDGTPAPGQGVISDLFALAPGSPGAANNNVITPAAGATLNPTIDLGFYTMSLGNLVWRDDNNNCARDAGEPPLPGLTVRLLDGAGSPVLGPDGSPIATVTNASGHYLFAGLAAGDYVVEVVPPSGYVSSRGAGGACEPAPDADAVAADDDDNGTASGATVRSAPVTLAAGAEPLAESGGSTLADPAPDASSNTTVDFGLFQPLSLGNQVWRDDNNNGARDAGEPGMAGVQVCLRAGDGATEIPVGPDGALGTADDAPGGTPTDANGLYLFSGLPPGDYVVELCASNFQTARPLEGYTSSTGKSGSATGPVEPGPDADANPSDRDDNGSNFGSVIRGAPVTLSPGAEPAGENPGNDPATPDRSSNLTVDFGVYRPASLGDLVFEDANRNGVQDAGDTGVPNVTATLHDAATNAPLATTTTDATGFYRFTNLAPGGYYVVFSKLPASYVFTTRDAGADDTLDSDADALSGKTTTYTLAAGEYNPTVDAGIYNDLRAQLGDRVWYDRNENGVQDAGEPGAPGVVVDLYEKQPNGTFARATTTTASDGGYLFGNLLAGDYYVQFAPPAGYTLSPRDAGGNTPASDQSDSDADPASRRTIATTLTPGESDLSWDAGLFYGAVAVGNRVWEDANNNCVYDGGEPGIAGVTVRLYRDADDDGAPDGAAIATTTTDANGYYGFAGLQPSGYIVEVARPAGYVSSSGANGADAGPCEGASTPDPDNNLDNRDDGTSAGTAARAKTVTVTRGAEPTGEPTALPNPDRVTPDANGNLTVDFGFYRPLSLGNLVWRDTNDNGRVDAGEPGVPGVTVRLFAGDGATLVATTTTNASGGYLFANLAPGGYIVEVDRTGTPLAGYTSSGDVATSAIPDNDVDGDDNGVIVSATTVRSGPVALSTGGEPADDPGLPAGNRGRNPTVDFGFVRLLSLGNQVWRDDDNNGRRDAGEPGIAGVGVCLRGRDGAAEIPVGLDGALGTADDAPGGTPTDASGTYLFSGLPPGDYVVELCGANFAPGGPLAGFTSSSGGGSEPAPDPDDDVNDDDNGTTQPDGTIRSLPVTLAAGAEPTNDGDGDANSNLTVDFGVYPPASLGDRVWHDLDKNGVQNPGEPGVPGVTVTLYRPGADNTPGTPDDVLVATTTTGPDGRYQFPGLPAGSYYVKFDLPSGYTRSPSDQGGDDAADSDADTSGRTPVVTLAPGQNNPTLDAGITFVASLGDRVWLDSNANGAQDAGEPGVPGVLVTLFTGAGAQVGQPATTDAAGGYAFAGLPPGDYYVQFGLPSGYARSPSDQGGDDAADSDADTTTGRTIVTTLAAGESDPTWDAGLYQPLSLGDLVWNDANNNGRASGAEPGLDGVTVNLYRDANGNRLPEPGELVATKITSGGGRYLFANLAPGSYIGELPPSNFAPGGPLAGYVSSSGRAGTNRAPGGPFEPAPDSNDDRDDDDNGTAAATGGVVSQPIALTSGGEPADDGDGDRNTNLTLDFGLVMPASVGRVVWIDADRDGTRGPAEPGVPNVTVTLYDGGGRPVAATTTDASGAYRFDRLPPGSYQVGFSNLPGGYAFTTPDRGGDDTRDSDVNPATGRTPLVALAPGQDNPTLYAGLVSIPTAITLTRFSATWEGGHVAVRWTTADERGTFGFLLLRSATGSRADAAQVTPQAILARGPGSDYSFVDTSALPGKTYSYWLVEIETGGARNEYGPVTTIGGPAGGMLVYVPLAVR